MKVFEYKHSKNYNYKINLWSAFIFFIDQVYFFVIKRKKKECFHIWLVFCSYVNQKWTSFSHIIGYNGLEIRTSISFDYVDITRAKTAQKMKFFIKYFFSKCDQIPRKLWIWSHLLKKSLMETFIFCAV